MQPKYLILFCILLAPFLSKTQDYLYTHEKLDAKSGLSNGVVNKFFQDSRGLMWIATNNGLNMYDGINFRTYIPKNNGKGIANNIIHCIVEDKEGNLWIGTANGLSFFDFAKKTFKNFNKKSHHLANNNILKIYIDEKRKIWIGGKNKVDIFDPKTEKIIQQLTIDKGISDLFADLNGDVYVIHEKGIQKYNPKKHKFQYIFKHNTNYKRLYRNAYVGRKNNIWFGLEGIDKKTYMSIYNIKTGQNRIIEDSSAQYTQQVRNRQIFYTQDKQGYIWKREGAYLNKINPENPTKQKLYFLKGVTEKGQKASLIFLDKNDIFWLNITGEGAVLLPKWRLEKIKYYHYMEGNPNSLSDKATRGVIKHQGKIWIGMYNDLDVFAESGKKIRAFLDLSAYCFAIDPKEPDRFLWIGTEGKGLYKMNQETYVYEQFLNEELIRIFAIAQEQSTLYLATHKGLIIFDTETEKHQLLHYHNTEKDEKVNFILHSNRAFLWVAMREDGLLRFDLKSQTFQKVNMDYDFSRNQIKSIYQDPKNILWIATDGGGFIKYNPKTKSMKVWKEEDGLANNVVYGILEDKKGLLWMSTNRGISEFNLKTEKFRNLDEYDGLQNNEFNTASFYQSPEGELFFGGINGINSFYPNDLFNPSVPEIWLKKVSTRHQEKHLHTSKQGFVLELSYEEAQLFTLEFAALSYYQSHRNQYKYIIEELYQDWKYLGNNAKVNEHLSPGTYIFKIKASNNHGLWNEKGMSIKIIVHAPFWQKWWFLFLTLSLFLALIYAIYRLRVRSLKKRQRELENTVVLRTQELQEKNEEILQQAEELKMNNEVLQELNDKTLQQAEKLHDANSKLKELDTFKENMIGMIVHDLKNPLNVIIGFSENEAQTNKLPSINQAGKRMLNMVSNILDVQKFENTEVVLNIEAFDARKKVENVLNQVYFWIKEKNIQLNIEIEDDLQITADKELVFRVLLNLLSNAIKFTPLNGQINIIVEKEEYKKEIRVSVEDNGKGIAKEDLEKIFMPFEQSEKKGIGSTSSTGLGLTFCRLAVEAHQGKISVNSEKGKGSIFWFTLPILENIPKNKNVSNHITDSSLLKGEVKHKFQEEDKLIIQKIKEKLQDLEVFETSKIRKILKESKSSQAVENWKDNILQIVYANNEAEWQKYIKNEEI